MTKKVPQRKEIPSEDTWNISALYSSLIEWEKDFEKIKKNSTSPFWPSLSKDNNSLSSPKEIIKLLSETLSLERKLDKLYTYAHMIHDEDISETKHQDIYQQIVSLYFSFSQEISWIRPALLKLPEEDISKLFETKEAQKYLFYLTSLFRLKPHTLDEKEESLIASVKHSLQTSSRTFSCLSDSDIPFPLIFNDKGEELPLSHALHSMYMQSDDRTLRKNSFLATLDRYKTYGKSFASLLQGKIQAHWFEAKARKHSSCLEAALFSNQIPTEVYLNLIKSVRNNLNLVHRFVKIKKKALELKEIFLFDMYAPIIPSCSIEMSYPQAVEAILSSLEPLGAEYCSILKQGLTKEGWVDKFENLNKRSGAYSTGCYDSYPYILLNYQNSIRDVATLTHEAGHSMHSYFSRKTQSYHDSQYPIFLAEIASTFNEALLMKYLQSNAKTKNEKIYLICKQLEDIYATLFRQTMFAEFELKIHEAEEKGISLTSDYFSNTYFDLVKDYFGKEMHYNNEIQFEWARIPHFYYNFYVYQYATGISAALCFAKRVLNQEDNSTSQYLNFLSSGGSDFPINILKTANLDMTSPQPIDEALSFLDSQLKILEKLF